MNPNPNYIVPRELCDFRQTWEVIEELASIYCFESTKKGPGVALEIEAKIGYAPRGKTPQQDIFLPILKGTSNQDFILMGVRGPHGNMQSYFPGFDYIGANYDFVKDRLSKKRYLEIKNFMTHQILEVPDKIKELESAFSIDFQLADGSRASYFPKDDKWIRIKKIEKTNIDILHRENAYRISLSFEEKLLFDPKTFSMDEVRAVRIKDRKNYQFQYMDYSFTEAVELSDSENDDIYIGFQLIKHQFMNNENKLDFLMEIFIDAKFKLLEENEIEVEITDLNPFLGTRGKPEFGSFLKRFIRNVESLFMVPRVFSSMISKEYFGVDVKLTPTIGQYTSELYMEGIKKSKAKKTDKKRKEKDGEIIPEKIPSPKKVEKKPSVELTLEKSKSEGLDSLFD